MTVVENGADLAALAATDRRVARDLSAAERDRIAATQRIAAQDAAAERRLREAEGQLDLQGRRDQVKADRRQRRAAQREADRRAKQARKAARWVTRKARAAGLVSYVRDNAASVYSSAIYGLAVAGAVYGQIDAARLHQIPMLMAVAASIAIEGTGLAMALTAQQQRLSRERAMAARALVGICTALAVTINYLGHVESNPAKAYVLSALSALGIVVFEIRSGAKHRQALRDLGMIAKPGEQFGMARWLAFPAETFAAWKLGVRDRLSPGAATLIARVEHAGAERRRRALVTEVAKRARTAARKAARKGDAGAALAALVRLSHTGTPAPLLALPSTAHVEAQNARAEAEAARRARAEAEAVAADATARAEAEAAARTEAEATAAAVRAEAEAARTAAAEAEARAEASLRRVRAEAAARAEAEAAAHTAGEQVRAEAARAFRFEGAAHASEQAAAAARQQLAGEQQRRVQAEARAEANQQLLSNEQHRRTRAEDDARAMGEQLAAERGQRQRAEAEMARLTPLAEQAQGLREQVEALQAGKPRTRRTPATAGEPVLFEGRPVPVVDGVSPATVAAVLTARKASPDATQKELASAVKTSDRTVRAVLTAAANEQEAQR